MELPQDLFTPYKIQDEIETQRQKGDAFRLRNMSDALLNFAEVTAPNSEHAVVAYELHDIAEATLADLG